MTPFFIVLKMLGWFRVDAEDEEVRRKLDSVDATQLPKKYH